MRLLSCDQPAKLSLTRDLVGDDSIPPYAILSHTWGSDDDEVSFADIQKGRAESKSTYVKLRFCMEQAKNDGLNYCWVDTCCIDRSSSSELQESINSMFRWYHRSSKCYVYLADVEAESSLQSSVNSLEDSLSRSRWFMRGWTLQELIAPRYVEFFDKAGRYLGSKSTLETLVSHITGISVDVLRGCLLDSCTIQERSSWMKNRRTKREEDEVYCLFGIFNVTMPVVYGEGRDRAYGRFLEEVSRYATIEKLEKGEEVQDLIVLLRNTMQRLEAQLSASTARRRYTASICDTRCEQITERPTFEPTQFATDGERMLASSAGTAGTGCRLLLRSLLPRLLSAFASPFGYFEKLQSFRPEAYIPHDLGPQIFSYSLLLEDESPESATTVQHILVAKDSRRWIRMTLKTTVSTGAVQRKTIAHLPSSALSLRTWRPLSEGVTSLIRQTIDQHRELSDDMELAVSLDKSKSALSNSDELQATSLTRWLAARSITSSLPDIESFRHQNIRIFPSDSLVTTFLGVTWLTTNVDNRWVGYRVALAERRGIHHLLLLIRTLLALRGCPYVVQMLGIVMDSETKMLHGILLDLPSKGPMFELIDRRKVAGRPIPWPIRQKWAKQIVRGIAAYHQHCHVVGAIRTYNWSVCIDNHDDARVLCWPDTSHPAVHNVSGLLPPEYRNKKFEMGDGDVEPEYDIYQMGSLLWHLYRAQDLQGKRTYCLLAGCDASPGVCCTEHENPIELPKAGLDVPEYLNRVINLCRQRNPRQRPSAWALLEHFPSDEEIYRQIDYLEMESRKLPEADLTRLETVRYLYNYTSICDRCFSRSRGVHYQCDTCSSSQWIVCSTCFITGEHCLNQDHYLAKIDKETLESQPLQYYSSVDRFNKRQEIIL